MRVCVWIIIADNTFERESEVILKMVLLLVKLKGVKIFIHQEMVTRNVNYNMYLIYPFSTDILEIWWARNNVLRKPKVAKPEIPNDCYEWHK